MFETTSIIPSLNNTKPPHGDPLPSDIMIPWGSATFLHDLGEHPLGALDTLPAPQPQTEEEPGAGQIAETATNMNK